MKEARPLIIQKLFPTPGHEQQQKYLDILFWCKSFTLWKPNKLQTSLIANKSSWIHLPMSIKSVISFCWPGKGLSEIFFLHPISRPQTTNKPPDWYNKLNFENGPHLAWNFHCCCSLALQAGWSLDGMADKPWRLSGLWRSVFLFKWRGCWGDVSKPKNPKFIITIHMQIHAGAMIYMKRSITSGKIKKKTLNQKHSTTASKVSMWLAFPNTGRWNLMKRMISLLTVIYKLEWQKTAVILVLLEQQTNTTTLLQGIDIYKLYFPRFWWFWDANVGIYTVYSMCVWLWDG